MFRRLMLGMGLGSLALVPGMALAEGGGSPAVTYIEGAVTTDIQTIGAAIIVLAAIVMGIRWVKAMFF